jgi:hypothetical protein
MTGNNANPAAQIRMGELAALVSTVESMLLAQESLSTIDADGILWPSRTILYAVMALQSETNARMSELIKELAGAASGLGFHWQRIRKPPPAIRKILRWRFVSPEAKSLSKPRVQARVRACGPGS